MHNHRHSPRNTIFSLAGWLFADLLLALTVIFIAASAPGISIAKNNPPPTVIIQESTPTPTPQPEQPTLDNKPFTFNISITSEQPEETEVIDMVTQKLNESNNSHRKVGFVLNLAGELENPGTGEDRARIFNNALKSMPNFKNAVFKDYHHTGNAPDTFWLEIYFFTTT